MTRPLRIRIISKATSLGGGGSRVAEELSAGLRRAGHDAVHLPGFYHHDDTEGTRHLYGKWCRKLIRATHDATARLGLQEILPVEFPAALRQGVLGADIVHFHDINAVASPLSVTLASLFAKVVWTFHDCSPFTAGCLYPNECRAYETTCRQCPEKGSWPLRANARTRVQFGLRRAVCSMTRFQPVTPSRWMRGMAERSAMRLAPIEVLPNGVDTDRFRPVDRNTLRRELGLPENGPLALISSSLLSDERKGAEFAFAALERMGPDAPHVVIVGNADDAVKRRVAGLRCTLTGYLRDADALAKHYACADFFLFPSLAENQPLSILETMACGVPCIAFDCGGVPELVRHDVTGWLAPPKDVDAFARGIRAALDPNVSQSWGEAALSMIRDDFSMGAFVDNHLALYRRVLA
jgi:Glycosyltransferase